LVTGVQTCALPIWELCDLFQRDRRLSTRVRAGVELPVEEPSQERPLRVRRLAVAPATRGIIALGHRPDRRGHEERRAQTRARPRQAEEPDVHVRLALDTRERNYQQIVDLETLGDRIDTLSGEHVVTLDALLCEPAPDGVSQADLEAPGPIQSIHHLMDRGVRQRAPAPRLDDGHDAQLELPRGPSGQA